MFPCGVYFSDVCNKLFMEVTLQTSPTPLPSCPEKLLVAHLHSGIILFATLYLKCLTVFWIRICLSNCSVICTMTLCYALYHTHSEFWHIQHSVFSGICRHIQLNSALLRHIDAFHAYWHIIKAYSELFRHIQHPV